MKLIIDIEKDYFEMIKYNVASGEKYKPFEIIADGTPYEERPQGNPCSNCQEFDCFGCKVKETDNDM